MTYIREDQADIRVSLDGIPYGGSWKTVQDGNLEADDSKTRPGGMGKEVALGGPAQRSDLKAQIQFSDVVAGWVKKFESRVGVGAVKVGVTWLSPERTPMGPTHTRVGILKGVTVPDMDSESSNPGMLEISVTMSEDAA